MKNELKPLPCPFCGAAGVMHTSHDMKGWCDAECGETCPGPSTDLFDDCWDALRAWNTRADDNRRCENCAHWTLTSGDGLRYCKKYSSEVLGSTFGTKPDFFCADFVKREVK